MGICWPLVWYSAFYFDIGAGEDKVDWLDLKAGSTVVKEVPLPAEALRLRVRSS